jgi:hypothetical protein
MMARSFSEIVRLDRRWFRAHPERKHRCRWPDMGELELCDSDLGAPLVMAIRHLGRGRIVYQPVIFQGVLPKDERSAAVLFALAARHPAPIPFVAEIDVLRLRRGVSRQQTATAGGGPKSQSSAGRFESIADLDVNQLDVSGGGVFGRTAGARMIASRLDSCSGGAATEKSKTPLLGQSPDVER